MEQKSNCYVWKPDKPHNFVPKRFSKPTYCEFCNSMIWGIVGKQGLKCKDCNFISHNECANFIPSDCINTPTKGHEHTWSDCYFTSPHYCAACRNIVEVQNGTYCLLCSVCAHIQCKNNLHLKCPITSFEDVHSYQEMKHFWIPGNIRGNCSVCSSVSLTPTYLQGWKCYWCKAKVCQFKCKAVYESKYSTCDLGKHKLSKLSPTSLVIKNLDDTSTWNVLSVPETSSPLICFVNPKSGGQIGNAIMQRLKIELNPHQIFDLTKGGPAPGLKLILNHPHINWRILACGGDGTVAWVLSEIDKLNFVNQPPVSVLPLGTGNDLARALGWGKGFSTKEVDTVGEVFSAISSHSTPVKLDRWELSIYEKDIQTGEYNSIPPKVINNYFSIGLDAKVALNFHKQRNETPQHFTNQTINKMWYAKFGTQAISDGCEGLAASIELKIDNKLMDLHPQIEAIVIVNLPSCYGGTFLWLDRSHCLPNPKATLQVHSLRIDDGLLEVVGIKNSVHLGQVRSGLSQSIIIGQGKEIEFQYNDRPWPVQIDGEPWEQPPCIIKIRRLNQGLLLADKDKAHWSLGLKQLSSSKQ